MFRFILINIWLFALPSFCGAQNAWTFFNQFNSDLPQNSIRCLYVDSINQKWIGTDYGLAVYNDTAWTIYSTSNSNLPDNSVRAIAVDSANVFWIGTQNGGVSSFSGGVWTNYNSSNSPLASDFIKSIAIDTSGAKWFGTTDGLFKFDDLAWETWNVDSGFLSNSITTVSITKLNMKCIGSLNGGLIYLSDTGMDFHNHFNGSLPDNTVSHIALDSLGNRWFTMPSGGLMAHYGGPSSWYATSNSSIQTDALNYVFVDKENRKYIASQNKGILVFDSPDFIHYDSTNSPMPESNALCVTKDLNGIVWIGTASNGLVRWDESIPPDGISDKLNKALFEIYPNPGKPNKEFFLQNEDWSELEMFDVTGRKILSKRPGEKLSFPTKAGFYFFRILSKNEFHSSVILVKD